VICKDNAFYNFAINFKEKDVDIGPAYAHENRLYSIISILCEDLSTLFATAAGINNSSKTQKNYTGDKTLCLDIDNFVMMTIGTKIYSLVWLWPHCSRDLLY